MIKDETRDSRSRARKPFLSSFPLPLRTEMEIENLRKPSELAILVAADFLFSPRSSNRGREKGGLEVVAMAIVVAEREARRGD